MKALVGKWRLNYPVKVVADLTHDQALQLLFGQKGGDAYDSWIGYEPMTLKVTIDYPLEKAVKFKVAPKLDCLKQRYVSLGLFLRDVARKYKKIYRKPGRHGIWGHSIDDLVFEAVTVDKDGNATLAIGS